VSATKHDVAVLIPSCDAYSDLWPPFFNLWERHWPDCPFPIYLGTEKCEFVRPGITVVRATPGAAWSDCVRSYLEQIPAEYVLVALEDFFLRDRVSTGQIFRLLAEVERRGAHCLRLVPRPGPALAAALAENREIGELPVGAAYRVSTQAAIWRRESLLALLQPGESAWQFEVRASARADALFVDGFYGVFRAALPYGHHVVERGQWFPWEAFRFGCMDIGCDFRRRQIMPTGATALWLMRKSKDLILAQLPARIRASLRSVIRG